MHTHAYLMLAAMTTGSIWCKVDPPKHFDNEWVVKMQGGPEEAQLVAMEMGYEYKGPLIGMKDLYLLEKPDHPTRSKRDASHLTKRLVDDERVLWAEQQEVRERVKRDFIDYGFDDPASMQYTNQGHNYYEYTGSDPFYEEEEGKGGDYLAAKRASEAPMMSPSPKTDPNKSKRYKERVMEKNYFKDPLWRKYQWYLHRAPNNYRQKADLNVVRCFQHGVTGKGVKVSILDDGLEFTHPDIQPNYDPEISYDINGNKPDPLPSNAQNAHGTRCAGEVAMVAGNNLCGVGVAYNCKIGAVRMLDGKINDRIESTAVGYAHDKVDVYSASWGPTDDGATLDGPGKLLRDTFRRGIREGRGGKGNIYVWAGGNGGATGDNCACDGYVNNLYTIAIGSVTQYNHFPFYGEQCPAVMAVSYSSGGPGEQNIASADLKGKCTTKHTGTSAAAPLAAAIIALALEVRPDLTWRDVQHMIVKTSRKHPLENTKGWKTNGAGLDISRKYGFGLLDAYGMVLAAESWTLVPPAKNCTIDYDAANVTLPVTELYDIRFKVEDCPDINYLEHVELYINIFTEVRGEVEVYLTSPTGEQIKMIFTRPKDKSSAGFKGWKILSVLFWNEKPRGEWTVQIRDNCKSCKPGHLGQFALVLHGTKDPPAYLSSTDSKPESPLPGFGSIEKALQGRSQHQSLKSRFFEKLKSLSG